MLKLLIVCDTTTLSTDIKLATNQLSPYIVDLKVGSHLAFLCLFASNNLFPNIKNPRLLLAGYRGQGQLHYIAPALLYELTAFPTHILSIALYESEGIRGINGVSFQ